MKFKNYIETESGIKDTSTSPGTAGQVLSSTVTGTSWIDQSSLVAGSTEVVEVPVKNLMGSELKKGDPVYISGSVGASGRLEVKLADASDPDKMPAVGLLKQDLVDNAEGFVVVTGKLRNLITSPIDGATPDPNDVIYVKPNGIAGAALTLTKPTGSSNLIQNMGKVGRVSTSNDGTFIVSSILRSNDIPNLSTGKIWVGDGNTTESTVVHLDETNGRMGIGTTTPQQALDVRSAISVGNSLQGDIYFSSVSNGPKITGVQPGLGGQLIISTGGSEKMRVTSGGDVGIGTTSPTSKVHIAGSLLPPNGAIITVTNSDATSSNATFGGIVFNSAPGIDYSIGKSNVNTATTLSFRNASTGASYMDIDSSGNVGIGTTSPSSPLTFGKSVYGNFDSENFYRIKLQDQGGTHNDVGIGQTASGNMGFNITSGNAFIFNNGTSGEIARFNGTGLGIGTTNPQEELHIASTVPVIRIEDTDGGYAQVVGSNGSLSLRSDQANTVASSIIDFTIDNSEKMRIDSSGNVGVGTTSPGKKLDINGDTIFRGELVIDGDSSVHSRINQTSSYLEIVGNNTDSADGTRMWIGTGQTDQGFYVNASNHSFRDTSSNTRMIINGSSGNVGIGTTSPSNKLHVHDSSAAYKGITLSGNAAPSIVFDSTNSVVDWKIGNSGTNANNFAISTSATSANESVVVTSDGNVGIGTTNPTGNLHVNSTAATASYFQGLNSTLRILNNTSNDNWLQSGTSTATSQAKLYVSGMNGSNITTTFDIPNGRVGIGTTVPSQTLDVGGNARVSGILYTNASVGSSVGIIGKAIPNGWASRYDSNNANYSGVYFDGNNQCIILGRNSGGTIVNYIHASGSSYFNGGNVGIGTTSPALKLEVEGGDGLLQLSTISSTGNPYMSFNQAGSRRSFIQHADSGDYLKLASEYGGISFFTGTGGTETQKMTILSGGNVGIGTTNPSYQLQLSLNSAAKPTSSAWTVVSDERVKTNIRSYKTGLQELLQVEPKLFDYNGKAGFDSSVKDNIGIIAQEIKDIMPETVKKYKAKLNESDVEETELYNFDGHAITFALINAVKELNTKIKELQNEIQTLKQNG